MKIKIACGIVFSCLSFAVLAKTANPLCSGVTGSTFETGNGTATNPYLICNQAQFNQISTNPNFLNQNFSMGADLSFSGLTIQIIGSQSAPFTGTFNGNGYTLSTIVLSQTSDYMGVFSNLNGASVQNLNINFFTITGVGAFVGGLAGFVEKSQVNNIHITNLNMHASDNSGGLIGWAQDSNVTNSSVQGVMNQSVDTNGSGGLIGTAVNTQVSSCAAHVNLVQLMSVAGGISAVGGLFGDFEQGSAKNCYSDGNIDYRNVTNNSPPQLIQSIGGIAGEAGNTSFSNCFSAGKFINLSNLNTYNFGGAFGTFVGTSSGIFWDTTKAGLTKSAAGTGEVTCKMKQKSFWLAQGFDPTIWILADNFYPKLVSESSNIMISPPYTDLALNSTMSFNANDVNGGVPPYTYSATLGSFSNSGTTYTYTASKPGLDTITVTDSESNSATIQVVVGYVDFGGMYGYSTNKIYNNPVTGTLGCPSGYTSQEIMGTSGVDYPLYYCFRMHTNGVPANYDFGGMYSYSGTGLRPNPLTGDATCPSDYTSIQVFGDSSDSPDYPAFMCYKTHNESIAEAAPFGGMYAPAYSANYNNPLTGGQSCPIGWTSAMMLGTYNVDYAFYFCY